MVSFKQKAMLSSFPPFSAILDLHPSHKGYPWSVLRMVKPSQILVHFIFNWKQTCST